MTAPTLSTFESYPLCIRRGLAMHASLMRVGVQAAEIFVGVALKFDESEHLTLIAVVKIAGEERMVCPCSEWDVAGVGDEDERKLLAIWIEAQNAWNAAPQEVREALFQEYHPDHTAIAAQLWSSGLLLEMQARKAAG